MTPTSFPPMQAPLIAMGVSACLMLSAAAPLRAGPPGGDPFLEDPFAHTADGIPEDDGALYRVTNVEDDDVLNIRDIPGVAGSTIMRALAPDAVNVRLTGATATVNGATWLEVTSSALPGGSGWVHSNFMTAQGPEESHSLGPEFVNVPEAELGKLYTDIEGYTQIDAQEAQTDWLEAAAGDDYDRFRQLNRTGPLTRALLLTRHLEGAPTRARYRLRLGLGQTGSADTPGGPRPVAFVQIDALDMTPEGVADGPHASYRMVMGPVQSRTADIGVLSRRDLPGEQVPQITCLGQPCSMSGPVAEAAQVEWQHTGPPDFPEAEPYPALTEHDVHSPEVILTTLANTLFGRDGQSNWQWPETPEGVTYGAPHLEAVLDVTQGQDFATDVILRNTAINDASTAEVWSRAISIAATGDEPLVSAMEYRKPGPSMPAPE